MTLPPLWAPGDPALAAGAVGVIAALHVLGALALASGHRLQGRAPAERRADWKKFLWQIPLHPLALGPAWLGGGALAACYALGGAICAGELLAIHGLSPGRRRAGQALSLVPCLGALLGGPVGLWGAAAGAALLAVALPGARRARLLALVFPGLGAAHLVLLAHHPLAFPLVALLYAAVEAGDSAAFLAGRALGGPLLWPALSPRKTVAGAGGAVVGAALVLACARFVLPALSVPVALALGALGGGLAQACDLFASAVKRRAEVKDFGGLIPAHGGLLDVWDSLLGVAPVVVLLAWWRWPA